MVLSVFVRRRVYRRRHSGSGNVVPMVQQGHNIVPDDENLVIRKWISVVSTSAITGERVSAHTAPHITALHTHMTLPVLPLLSPLVVRSDEHLLDS
jgi:hypothetical protein